MDDACDEDGLGADPVRLGPAISTLLDVLDRCGDPHVVPPAVGPLGDALHDLCRRTRLHDARRHCCCGSSARCGSTCWRCSGRRPTGSVGACPRWRSTSQLRRHIGGVHPCLTLTDLASARPLGPTQRANPALVALDLLAVDLVCWCNDLFSYGKESQADPDAHNLVTVLAQDGDADEAAALRAAATGSTRGWRRTWTRRRRCCAGGDDGMPRRAGRPAQLGPGHLRLVSAVAARYA